MDMMNKNTDVFPTKDPIVVAQLRKMHYVLLLLLHSHMTTVSTTIMINTKYYHM
jgi:hypothetical protein